MSTKREGMLRGSVNPHLTALAQQYRQKAFVSQFLMPALPVTEMTGEYYIFGSEHMKLHNSKRALGAMPNQMPLEDWTKETFALEEYALERRIDYRESEAAEKIMSFETFTMKQILRSLDLQQEMAAATLLQTEGTYDSTHYVALTTGGYFDTAAVDPIATISTGMTQVYNDTNEYPNVVVLGPTSFDAVKNHPLVRARVATTKSGVVTTDLIGELLSTDENKVVVKVGTGKYKETTGVMTNIWGNTCVIGFNQNLAPQVDEFEMSFGKMITRKGYPWVLTEAVKQGMFTDMTVVKQYKPVITNALAGYLIANTITP